MPNVFRKSRNWTAFQSHSTPSKSHSITYIGVRLDSFFTQACVEMRRNFINDFRIFVFGAQDMMKQNRGGKLLGFTELARFQTATEMHAPTSEQSTPEPETLHWLVSIPCLQTGSDADKPRLIKGDTGDCFVPKFSTASFGNRRSFVGLKFAPHLRAFRRAVLSDKVARNCTDIQAMCHLPESMCHQTSHKSSTISCWRRT